MRSLILLPFLPLLALSLTPRERFTKLKELHIPFLETYWESYVSFPYNYTNCYYHENPLEIDYSDYGVDLSKIPVANVELGEKGVNIINIAFAKSDIER